MARRWRSVCLLPPSLEPIFRQAKQNARKINVIYIYTKWLKLKSRSAKCATAPHCKNHWRKIKTFPCHTPHVRHQRWNTFFFFIHICIILYTQAQPIFHTNSMGPFKFLFVLTLSVCLCNRRINLDYMKKDRDSARKKIIKRFFSFYEIYQY